MAPAALFLNSATIMKDMGIDYVLDAGVSTSASSSSSI
jgi:hypothetical protein